MEKAISNVVEPVMEFAKDSRKLINKCNKPDSHELKKIATSTAIGFLCMGMIGFVVKLVFIPINNIILGV